VYPADTPTFIVNLDSIFDNPDSALGYYIWMKLRPNTDVTVLLYQLKQMLGGDTGIVEVKGNAFTDIQVGQDEAERKGLFGVLNVGFLITGLMPGIGFLLYSYASLRRRFIQLGILQAIGLSVRQLIGYLSLEQFLLMGIAILSGAGIGLLTSVLYVPFLQTGAAPGAPVPPFQVLVGWVEAGWLSVAFGAILLLTLIGTIFYLVRLKVFQAVKMGESL
jgi:putative ABC transport system permease protein